MINVAIIGAGAISRSHIRAYQAFPDRCRIVAVVDIKIERAKERIASFGLDAVALDNHEAVLAGYDIDLASVCTPPSSHAEISCHLLDAGINTLCESRWLPHSLNAMQYLPPPNAAARCCPSSRNDGSRIHG